MGDAAGFRPAPPVIKTESFLEVTLLFHGPRQVGLDFIWLASGGHGLRLLDFTLIWSDGPFEAATKERWLVTLANATFSL